MTRYTLNTLFGALLFSFSSWAEKSYRPLPAAHDAAETSGLLGRVVRYDGSTNGQMVLEVKNPTAAGLAFSADGLYFIPAVNPDTAPQRLGAVGGFDVSPRPGRTKERHENYTVGPGETVQMHLDVFCIDSHRASPSSETPFHIAKTRMPRKLTTLINDEARKEAAKVGGFAAPQSKSSTPNAVWKNRDAQWIRLQGESTQEATK